VSDNTANPGPILVDARGHRCPVPSLRLRRALEICAEGGEVELLTDDPLARIDVPHLINSIGYQIVFYESSNSILRFKIRKERASV
jgi:tRNA 2-thiouridine synthesizing protein A